MSNEKLGEMNFSFNEKNNGGQRLSLKTIYLDDGSTNQFLNWQSRHKSVTIDLNGVQMTPENLRALASQLEHAGSEFGKS